MICYGPKMYRTPENCPITICPLPSSAKSPFESVCHNYVCAGVVTAAEAQQHSKACFTVEGMLYTVRAGCVLQACKAVPEMEAVTCA